MTDKKHLSYINCYLGPEITEKITNEIWDSFEVEHSTGLDGFMSALYTIRLQSKTLTGQVERLLIAKFMKGSDEFRETSKSYIQFANEIFIYGKVLPYFEQLLKAAGSNISIRDWCPRVYKAEFGYVEGLSETPSEREAVLVLDNLKRFGYKNGPRLYLDREHLLLMCKPLGEYHAMSYVLRLTNLPKLEHFKSKIIELPFINDKDPNDIKNNLYRVLYRVGFDRFYEYFDRIVDTNVLNKENSDDIKLIERLQKLRDKYFTEPTLLLERLRKDVELREADERFAAILHGDYNRNNVLFQYKNQPSSCSDNTTEQVVDIKMIDFQELRYGTPAIDLSFFMFMNTSEDIRADIWLDILKEYHNHMYQTLSSVLKAYKTNEKLKDIDEKLKNYSFECFNAHFSRFAFYGVMICIHFLPWILCSEKECERLSYLFENSIHSEEFRLLSISAGGDDVNLKILNVIRHACKMGYMDNI